MRVRLLGTGSADGWPNAFCECASCRAERSAKRSRKPSCALVDDVLLIDAGPTMPYAAADAGISLAGVRDVLLTHGHPDHLAPSFLLWREWIAGLPMLDVHGPQLAIDQCRDWIGPDSPIRFHVVAPGDEFLLASDYRVRVLDAAHDPAGKDVIAYEAVLYDIEAEDGSALLYATDTGPFTQEMLDGIAGRYYDLVLVDQSFGDKADHGTGHFDLTTLPTFLNAVRTNGAVISTTRVIATHLSHHNPPTAQLLPRLATLGVELHDDLTVIDTDGRAPIRTLITGGVRSGKSHRAEALLARESAVTYLATGYPLGDDADWNARIAEHLARRPAHWRTVESIDIPVVLAAAPANSAVLIDCMALWTTRVLDSLDAWADPSDPAVRAGFSARVDELVDALGAASCDVVIVTNEVGNEVVADSPGTRLFRDLMGELNRRLADACTDCTVTIAGRAIELPRDEGAR